MPNEPSFEVFTAPSLALTDSWPVSDPPPPLPQFYITGHFHALARVLPEMHGGTLLGNLRIHLLQYSGPGKRSRYSDSLRTGQFGEPIPVGWGGRDFQHPSRPVLGPTHIASHTMGTGSFPELKRPGRGVDTPSSAEVEGRVELYLYSPSGSSWPVLW